MLDQIKSLVKEKGIEYFLCSFVELSGAPKAKLVPAAHLDDMAREGAGFAGFAAGDLRQGPHDPDIVSLPDFNALTILPWRNNVAWVPGNLHVNGESWPYCPRTVLVRQLECARKKGYIFHVGVEPEFILLKKNSHEQYEPWDVLDNAAKPCYDLRALYRNLGMMTTLLGYMQQLGWDPYANDHEDANCQFEINWVYSDALTTADRHTFFKWMVRTVAEQNGLWATFMPKPFAHLTGNGAHYHLSLADVQSRKNLFLDESDALGLSQLGRWFMGGLLHHARGLAAVIAPLVNSYKRLIRGAPLSGATWAPVYVTYGASNRTQMIRIPGPGRIENRAADGAANPYLAMAVMLAAGLDGIERKIDPGPANSGNLYEMPEAELRRRNIAFLPTTLREALDCFEQDDVVRQAMGEDYAAYYVDVKREEWREYHQNVSQWERDRYLNTF
ncbi:MAG TPA: type III glutamate--ammonia ligase [Bryobacteraceae bacterium]|nr:type III glutamate--ammonia ligase [Bryobacteraceae bacterium]